MAWFALVRGWGGLALAVNGFPGAEGDFKRTLYDVGTVIWLWDTVYCGLFLVLLAARVATRDGLARGVRGVIARENRRGSPRGGVSRPHPPPSAR